MQLAWNLETSPDGRISTTQFSTFPSYRGKETVRDICPLSSPFFFSRTVTFFPIFYFLFFGPSELTGNQNSAYAGRRISLYVVIEVLSSRVCLKSRSLRMDVM